MSKKIRIESATIRSWGIKRKRDRLYPYVNLTSNDDKKNDYTLYSDKEMLAEDLVGILNVLCVTNTKDLVNLGVRLAISDGKPFAIGNIVDERWLAFTEDEYFLIRGDKNLKLIA